MHKQAHVNVQRMRHIILKKQTCVVNPDTRPLTAYVIKLNARAGRQATTVILMTSFVGINVILPGGIVCMVFVMPIPVRSGQVLRRLLMTDDMPADIVSAAIFRTHLVTTTEKP